MANETGDVFVVFQVFIDVAIVATRLCEQMGFAPAEMLDYLKGRGCRIGGVTMGERGLLWYDETGTVRSTAALAVPADKIVDTSGAGDVFHGGYVFSYLRHPQKSWRQHLEFASHAAAHKVQHLGNEAGLPTLNDVEAVAREFPQADDAAPRPARDSVAAMRASR